MTFDWYARYHRDALDGMLSLTLEERGAYNTLLDLIYSRGQPIPDDGRWLAGWMGCSLRKWNTIRAGLIFRGKIHALSFNGVDCLMNARAADELLAADYRRRKLSENGAKGGRKPAQTRQEVNENNGVSEAPPKHIDIDRTLQCEEAIASLSSADDAALPRTYPEPFEIAWKAYPHIRGRSSKRKALGVWRRIPAAVRDRLPAAVNRYAREGREPKQDCGAPAMERWLKDGRFEDWLTPERPSEPPTPQQIAWRHQHFRDTGEWRPEWGEREQAA